MPLTGEQWTTLAADLQRALARMVPEWTDHNTHDPGITVLEALCYVLTDLQYRVLRWTTMRADSHGCWRSERACWQRRRRATTIAATACSA